MTQKIDFKKTLDSYQARAGEFRVIWRIGLSESASPRIQ